MADFDYGTAYRDETLKQHLNSLGLDVPTMNKESRRAALTHIQTGAWPVDVWEKAVKDTKVAYERRKREGKPTKPITNYVIERQILRNLSIVGQNKR